MYKHGFRLGVALAICLAAAIGAVASGEGSSPESKAVSDALAARLDTVRQATERFKDVNVALKEGYVRDPMDMCIDAPMEGQPRQLGGMGIHFFRPDLLQLTGTSPRVAGRGTHTDFSSPAVLVYEPQRDGSLSLVAVENLVFADAWQAAGRTALPEFEGNEYYRMVDNPATANIDEAHEFMPHYELHMWLYRENRNGLFAQFNPDVSCQFHKRKQVPGK